MFPISVGLKGDQAPTPVPRGGSVPLPPPKKCMPGGLINIINIECYH